MSKLWAVGLREGWGLGGGGGSRSVTRPELQVPSLPLVVSTSELGLS